MVAPVATESLNKPTVAMAEHIANNPSGDKRWTIGPANSRKTIIIADVYTKTQPAWRPSATIAGSISEVIQLSVPISVVASGIMISSMTINNRRPGARAYHAYAPATNAMNVTAQPVGQTKTRPTSNTINVVMISARR